MERDNVSQGFIQGQQQAIRNRIHAQQSDAMLAHAAPTFTLIAWSFVVLPVVFWFALTRPISIIAGFLKSTSYPALFILAAILGTIIYIDAVVQNLLIYVVGFVLYLYLMLNLLKFSNILGVGHYWEQNTTCGMKKTATGRLWNIIFSVTVALASAWLVLWACYGFQGYHASVVHLVAYEAVIQVHKMKVMDFIRYGLPLLISIIIFYKTLQNRLSIA